MKKGRWDTEYINEKKEGIKIRKGKEEGRIEGRKGRRERGKEAGLCKKQANRNRKVQLEELLKRRKLTGNDWY